jgi:hypothetical protein
MAYTDIVGDKQDAKATDRSLVCDRRRRRSLGETLDIRITSLTKARRPQVARPVGRSVGRAPFPSSIGAASAQETAVAVTTGRRRAVQSSYLRATKVVLVGPDGGA